MRISDWSSDVCSSDLISAFDRLRSGSKALILNGLLAAVAAVVTALITVDWPWLWIAVLVAVFGFCAVGWNGVFIAVIARQAPRQSIGLATGATLSITFAGRSAEHTSELPSLMRHSYA